MSRRSSDRPTRPTGRSSSRRTGRNDGPTGPSQRQLRVGEALRHALAEVLTRNDIRDPELEGVSVTINAGVTTVTLGALAVLEPSGTVNVAEFVS